MKSNNGNKKSKQQPKKQGKTRAPRRRSATIRANPLLEGHVKMVVDPCSAPIVPTAYAGVEGQIQRFVSSGNLTSTTEQAAIISIVPGGFRESFGVRATGSTAIALGYGTVNVPGYNFLQANSKGARVVGACLRIHWNSTELSRAGSIACGVVPASTVKAGATITADQLYGLLSEKQRIPSGECEIVWNPSEEDMSYDICDSTVTVTNFDDKNAMCFVYQGPAGFQLGWSLTVIYEWTPATGLGMVQHTSIHKSVPDAISQINNVLGKIGFRNKPLETAANTVFGTMAKYTPTGNALKLIKTATGVVHTLLP